MRFNEQNNSSHTVIHSYLVNCNLEPINEIVSPLKYTLIRYPKKPSEKKYVCVLLLSLRIQKTDDAVYFEAPVNLKRRKRTSQHSLSLLSLSRSVLDVILIQKEFLLVTLLTSSLLLLTGAFDRSYSVNLKRRKRTSQHSLVTKLGPLRRY